jgi:hypothetical protein
MSASSIVSLSLALQNTVGAVQSPTASSCSLEAVAGVAPGVLTLKAKEPPGLALSKFCAMNNLACGVIGPNSCASSRVQERSPRMMYLVR